MSNVEEFVTAHNCGNCGHYERCGNPKGTNAVCTMWKPMPCFHRFVYDFGGMLYTFTGDFNKIVGKCENCGKQITFVRAKSCKSCKSWMENYAAGCSKRNGMKFATEFDYCSRWEEMS